MADSDLSSAVADMSLSDLSDMPPRRRAHQPARPSRFTLLAQRDAVDETDDADEADESYMEEDHHEEPAVPDEEHWQLNDEQEPLVDVTGEAQGEQFDLDAVEATPRAANGSIIPASQTFRQSVADPSTAISEEDRLRQQLFDMQRLNEAFSMYETALIATREKQKSLVTKVDRTKQLLDRYVAILGQTEHNARLLLDPSWEGAQADEARIAEEKRREEQARLEREAAERRKEEERQKKETEAREAAERAAAARGRGTTRGVRGRGAPVVRSRTPITSSAPGRRTIPQPTSGTTSTTGSAGRGRAKPTAPSGLRAPTAGRALVRGAGSGRGTRAS